MNDVFLWKKMGPVLTKIAYTQHATHLLGYVLEVLRKLFKIYKIDYVLVIKKCCIGARWLDG